MRKNFNELLKQRLNTPKKTLAVGEFDIQIIAVSGDYKDMIESAEDVLSRYIKAAVYGLRDGMRPLIETTKAPEESIHEMFSEPGMPDDAVTVIAEEVLSLSGLEDLIYDEEKDSLEIEEDEEEDESGYPLQP